MSLTFDKFSPKYDRLSDSFLSDELFDIFYFTKIIFNYFKIRLL